MGGPFPFSQFLTPGLPAPEYPIRHVPNRRRRGLPARSWSATKLPVSQKPTGPGKELSPAMEQWKRLKAQYPDCVLFFRMGDFYELFFEDAEEAAPLLELVLTSRSKAEDAIPMAGVPYHAAQGYIERLLSLGRKVALCEQMEDPKTVKGLVKRDVVRVYTPGLHLKEGAERESRYVAAVWTGQGGRCGLAAMDLATGDFLVAEPASAEELELELARLGPCELLVPEGYPAPRFTQECFVQTADGNRFEARRTSELVRQQFALATTEGLGLGEAGLRAAGGLIGYVRETQKAALAHLNEIRQLASRSAMLLDDRTLSHLEVFRNQSDGSEKNTLISAIDRTKTAAGSRLLKQRIRYPVLDPAEISVRLGVVEALLLDGPARRSVREQFERVADIERILARVSLESASARDLVALAATLERIPELAALTAHLAGPGIVKIREGLNPLPEIRDDIRNWLKEDPPVALREGGLIREGADPRIDEYRELRSGGRAVIARIEAGEKERTGIPSLKVGFNRVFGYFLEVTNTHKDRVPPEWIRKQTLANAERYVTPELKEIEEKVLNAEERLKDLEYERFVELRGRVKARTPELKQQARLLAELDVYASLADLADTEQWTRPELLSTRELSIQGGRHPVVEKAVGRDRFTPNDLVLDGEDEQVMILTGPNMAGKSTIMRQVAIIVILAQSGSFVPVAKARIGLVDRVFTRVGASDALARGLSTFMMEMTETAAILRRVTPRSLVLLDEIGRGTSTFDGLSIAWAVAEYLHDLPASLDGQGSGGVRTIFATHYHELTKITETHGRCVNYTVACREWEDEIVFLHTLERGSAPRSYGIQVAQLAGLPKELLARAKKILGDLETGSGGQSALHVPAVSAKGAKRPAGAPPPQLNLLADPREQVMRELERELEKLDPDSTRPIDALNLLVRWKEKLKG